MIINKPWGTYEVLLDEPSYKVKRIRVKSHSRFSLQYHNHREEHWIIIDGIGTVTQDDNKFQVRPGEYVHIPIGQVHRLYGGESGITFIEIQKGKCTEDDIVRLEDDYGRGRISVLG